MDEIPAYLTEKINKTRAKNMTRARKYLVNKLRHRVKYGNDRLYIRKSTMKHRFHLTNEDANALIEEFENHGWVINMQTYTPSNPRFPAYSIRMSDKIKQSVPQKATDAELLSQARKDIEELKEQREELKNQIRIMPGGVEYLEAEQRFNSALGIVPNKPNKRKKWIYKNKSASNASSA